MRLFWSAILGYWIVWLGLSGNNQAFGNDYYNQVFLGQKNTELYYGPFDNRHEFTPEVLNTSSLDERFFGDYLWQYLQPQMPDLKHFLEIKMLASSCPNQVFGQHINYIRYLYRLIFLSYLYESLNRYDHALRSVAGKGCGLNWGEVFDRCEARSQDMKKFKTRGLIQAIKFPAIDELKKYHRIDKKKWINGLKNIFETQNVAQKRIANYCENKNKNCSDLSSKSAMKYLKAACQEDLSFFNSICSERDEIYSVPSFPEFTSMIMYSNAVYGISRKGHGRPCVDRFASLFESASYVPATYADIFELVRMDLKKAGNSPYIEGALFLPGSLKSFDDKGLQSFLFATPTPVPTIETVETPVPTPVVTQAMMAKALPTPVATPVIVPTVKPTPKALSAFEQAVQVQKAKNLELVDVDMDKLKSEFKLNDKKIEIIGKLLEEFQVRENLRDMKRYDNLGSAKEPMRLLFIKFLIEQDKHKGLYNVVSVIGKRFYLLNDIERKKDPVIAELVDPQESKLNRWQIRLRNRLLDPTPKAAPVTADKKGDIKKKSASRSTARSQPKKKQKKKRIWLRFKDDPPPRKKGGVKSL